MKNKKLCSLLLTIILMFNMFAIMPLNAFALSGDSRTYEKDGYTVTYKIGSEWENNRTVEVNIKNTGEESILNWALKYDVGGEMSNLWNSKLYEKGEDYVIIKNNGYNYEIEPEQSISCGYIVTGKETVIPEDIELCSRRIDVSAGYDVDFNITSDWHTGFQAEVTIENTSTEPIEAWTLFFDGNFTINNIWNAKLLSSENGKYEVANQLWTTPIKVGESASFGFTADKSATENAKAENFQLTAMVIGESILEKEPVIDYELDTDEDGLPDYYEDILGTDKNKADTDGDGLSDGYEVLYLGTDPLKVDSNDNGVNDGDEDFDKDGLTNAKECELGTDPNNADTDGDGLNDGAEVNTYGTNPLKYDTDGDGISDGDEITLGLDPKSAATDGTPDGEHTFTQTVEAESDVLSAINDNESLPFDVSLEMKAAGVAENNVYVRESGYSNAIENTAIIGVAPEFVYTDGLTVEEVTVKFELENSVINNTLGTYTDESDEFKGIKRLNVFMFFEDVNMLLPVETFHDEATNTVYTKTDRVGTYCLVDMEIFLDNLDKQLNGDDDTEAGIEVQSEESEAMLHNSLDNDIFSSYNVNKVKLANSNVQNYSNSSDDRKFDVDFLIDCRDITSDNKYAIITRNIIETADTVFTKSPNARVRIVEMLPVKELPSKSYKPVKRLNIGDYSDSESVYFYNLDEVYSALEYLKKDKDSYKDYINCDVSDAINYVYTTSVLDTYVFCIVQSEKILFQAESENAYKVIDKINEDKNDKNKPFVDISTIFTDKRNKKYGYAIDISKLTSGIVLDYEDFSSKKMIEHIYNGIPEINNGYKAITALGYKTVVLNSSLSQNYKWSTGHELNKIIKADDLDSDGLFDFQEIMFENSKGDLLVDKVSEDNIQLLKYKEIVKNKDLFYVERGLERYCKVTGENSNKPKGIDSLLNCKILPIKSDPTNDDGDGDGLKDSYDPKPLCIINNGKVMSCFNEYSLNNFKLYNDVDYLYTTSPHGDNTFEFFCDQYGVDMDRIREMQRATKILQESLEYLGYLDMTNPDYNPNEPEDPEKNPKKIPYGTFGGLTKAAVQAFQLNYGFVPLTGEPGDYGVDYYTFQTIVNIAIINGCKLDNYKTQFGEIEYRAVLNDCITDDFEFIKPYYTYIKSVEPVLTSAEKMVGVKIVPTKGLFDDRYYLDLTKPIEKMLQKNAVICHNHCYVCNNENGIYHCTRLDIKQLSNTGVPGNLNGYLDVKAALYFWFYLQVRNGAHWDIKRQENWNKQFNAINDDEKNIYESIDDQIRYFQNSFEFYFNGKICTPEILGNILLGFTGTASGFGESILVACAAGYSEVAQGAEESDEDSYYIRLGVSMFEEIEENKQTFDKYVHK